MPRTNGYPANLTEFQYLGYQPKLKGLSGIYLNTAIRDLAFGVLGILIPIYIYQTTHSLITTVLFYLIYRLTTLITLYPSTKLIEKIGPDLSMLLSSFLAAFYLTFLSMISDFPQFIWISPIVGGLQLSLHWLPYHTAFSNVAWEHNLSKNITNASGLSQIARAFAPFVGGIIAVQFGFPSLLLASVLLLIVSSLPVFFDEYNTKEKVLPLKKLFKEQLKPGKKLFNLSLFFQGFRTAIDSVIWPLIIYFAIPNFRTIGGITTITLLTSILTLRWIGKNLKHFKIYSFVNGNIARSFVWFIRAITNFPLIIALTDPIYQFATLFVDIPRTILIYQYGKREKLNFFAQREAALTIGQISSLALVIFILKAGLSWKLLPLIPIAAMVLDNFCTYKYSKRQKSLLEKFRIKITRL